MEQLITLILEATVIYFVVRVLIAIFQTIREAKQSEAAAILAAQEQATNDIEITIEVHNDVAYFFNKNTNEFIAQGSNAVEFVDHIKDRKYTDVKFLIDNTELAKVAWLDEVFRTHKVEA